MDAIISQPPEEQGREALLNLYRHVVPGQQILPKKYLWMCTLRKMPL
jgi:hypothetical protein